MVTEIHGWKGLRASRITWVIRILPPPGCIGVSFDFSALNWGPSESQDIGTGVSHVGRENLEAMWYLKFLYSWQR